MAAPARSLIVTPQTTVALREYGVARCATSIQSAIVVLGRGTIGNAGMRQNQRHHRHHHALTQADMPAIALVGKPEATADISGIRTAKRHAEDVVCKSRLLQHNLDK